MAHRNTKLLKAVFGLHFYFIVMVYDIYFSPNIIEKNINLAGNFSAQTTTKRLVLFVGGGLPAEHVFESSHGFTNVPFLRSVIENNGTWGVSHTGAFSGCRPGHIATIAGFYEDPIYAIRALMGKPILFDSVFNQSSITFAWGSPRIVPIFSTGSRLDHIHFRRYPPEIEDISCINRTATQANMWVLNNFKHFVNYTLNYYKTDTMSRVIFFFHLSSTDVAGNIYKPYSMEYNETIKNMDMVIKELYMLIEEIFYDKNTTFLFTSDHGVTAWGSHGGGSKIETQTPVIAWGSGIKKPVKSNISGDLTGDNWKLAHLSKQVIKQVDIAVLMSILLGVSIPDNSVGTLPLNFLDFSDEDKAKLYLLNARQLIMLLKAAEDKVNSQLANCLFYPYADNTFRNHEEIFTYIEKAINNFEFTTAENLTHKLILSSLAGFYYYHQYFQNFLLACTVLSYIGMGAILVGEIMIANRKNCVSEPIRELFGVRKHIVKITYSFLILTVFLLGHVNALPSRYTIYPAIALTLWYYAIVKYSTILKELSLFHPLRINEIVLYVLGSQLIVQSFYQKWVLSLVFIAFCFWPGLGIFTIKKSTHAVTPTRYRLLWCFSCIGLSIFPLLPIIGAEEKLFFKIATGIAWMFIELFIFKTSVAKNLGLKFNLVSKLQIFLNILLLWHIYRTSDSLQNGEGLQLVDQCTSYIYLALFLGLMYHGPDKVLSQFNTLSYSVGLTFLMFASSYEAIFPMLLAANLLCWLLFERMIDIRYSTWPASILTCDEIGLHNHNFRRSIFFVFYITLSFYGIGNLASLNSYDMTWGRLFVSSFSPNVIMSITVVKVILPSILVTSAFRFVAHITQANSKVLFLIAVLICDSVALQFLLSVKNTGSSLEIEKSVSNVIIMQIIALLLFMLNRCAKHLTIAKILFSFDCDNILRKWHDA